MDENTHPGTNIASPVVALDSEGDALTCTLDGDDADSFDIVALT